MTSVASDVPDSEWIDTSNAAKILRLRDATAIHRIVSAGLIRTRHLPGIPAGYSREDVERLAADGLSALKAKMCPTIPGDSLDVEDLPKFELNLLGRYLYYLASEEPETEIETVIQKAGMTRGQFDFLAIGERDNRESVIRRAVESFGGSMAGFYGRSWDRTHSQLFGLMPDPSEEWPKFNQPGECELELSAAGYEDEG